jgi:hypothetical protein
MERVQQQQQRAPEPAPEPAPEELKPELAPEMPMCFLCPISQEPMEDPVVTVAGNTYDRTHIRMWLHTNNTDPLSNERLATKRLISNNAIRSQIAAWRDANGLTK